MSLDKFLSIGDSGELVEEGAIDSSAGSADASKIIKTNASGFIDETLIPGVERIEVVCSEDLDAGDIVNIWDNAGVPGVRKADASAINAGKRAHGFVTNSYVAGDTAVVYGEGKSTGHSTLIPGTTYYLAETPGDVTSTPVTTSGSLLQKIGVAVDTSTIVIEFGEPIVRY